MNGYLNSLTMHMVKSERIKGARDGMYIGRYRKIEKKDKIGFWYYGNRFGITVLLKLLYTFSIYLSIYLTNLSIYLSIYNRVRASFFPIRLSMEVGL